MELGNLVFGNSREEYPVNRKWQKSFCEYLYDMGFDSYGVIVNENLKKYEVEVKSEMNQTVKRFENETFVIMPYYWGEDDQLIMLPNFVYKKTGFELHWYKYALRDSYMNQDVTWEELEGILIECKKSLQN